MHENELEQHVLLVSAVPTYALRWWGLFLCLNGLFIKMYSIKLEKNIILACG